MPTQAALRTSGAVMLASAITSLGTHRTAEALGYVWPDGMCKRLIASSSYVHLWSCRGSCSCLLIWHTTPPLRPVRPSLFRHRATPSITPVGLLFKLSST